jgi:hypothetical protein
MAAEGDDMSQDSFIQARRARFLPRGRVDRAGGRAAAAAACSRARRMRARRPRPAAPVAWRRPRACRSNARLPRCPTRQDADDGSSAGEAGPSPLEQRMEAAAAAFEQRPRPRSAAASGEPRAPPRARSPAPHAQRRRRMEQRRAQGRGLPCTGGPEAAAPPRARVEYVPPPRPWLQQAAQRGPCARARAAHLLPPSAAQPQPCTALPAAPWPQVVTVTVFEGAAGASARPGYGGGSGGGSSSGASSASTGSGSGGGPAPPGVAGACGRPLSAPAGRRGAAAAAQARQWPLAAPPCTRGRPATAAAGAVAARACWGTLHGTAATPAASAWLAHGQGATWALGTFPARLRPEWDATPLLPSQHLSCGAWEAPGAGAAQRPASSPRAAAAAARPWSLQRPGAGGAAAGGAAGAAAPYLEATLAAVQEANAWCRALGLPRRYRPAWDGPRGGGRGGQLCIEAWEEEVEPAPPQPPRIEEEPGRGEATISSGVAAWGWAGAQGGGAAPARRLSLQQFQQQHRALRWRVLGSRRGRACGGSARGGRGASGRGTSGRGARHGAGSAAPSSAGRPVAAVAAQQRARMRVPPPAERRGGRGSAYCDGLELSPWGFAT